MDVDEHPEINYSMIWTPWPTWTTRRAFGVGPALVLRYLKPSYDFLGPTCTADGVAGRGGLELELDPSSRFAFQGREPSSATGWR